MKIKIMFLLRPIATHFLYYNLWSGWHFVLSLILVVDILSADILSVGILSIGILSVDIMSVDILSVDILSYTHLEWTPANSIYIQSYKLWIHVCNGLKIGYKTSDCVHSAPEHTNSDDLPSAIYCVDPNLTN